MNVTEVKYIHSKTFSLMCFSMIHNKYFPIFFFGFSPTVLDDQQNVRPIKELLQTLYVSLCGLVQDMGKSVLVGNINIWVHRMENILQWQQQLDNIQINRVNICPKYKISSWIHRSALMKNVVNSRGN